MKRLHAVPAFAAKHAAAASERMRKMRADPELAAKQAKAASKAMQRVPAIVNVYLSVDMGRMAPQYVFRGKIVFLRVVTKAQKTGHAWRH